MLATAQSAFTCGNSFQICADYLLFQQSVVFVFMLIFYFLLKTRPKWSIDVIKSDIIPSDWSSCPLILHHVLWLVNMPSDCSACPLVSIKSIMHHVQCSSCPTCQYVHQSFSYIIPVECLSVTNQKHGATDTDMGNPTLVENEFYKNATILWTF